ncbi:MAG: hypothetical protein KF729_05330 [Sandaracinaceae bacterium]|nr:hypothetical protein [Sandaracinaceae bacterium]
MTRSASAVLAAALFACACEAGGDTDAAQPPQPERGPGGSDYVHGSATITRYGAPLGDAAAYWLIEPAEPTPAQAPVLVYMHGWSAFEPEDGYEAMLVHLARKGFVIVFPYQGGPLDRSRWEGSSRQAVQRALDELARGAHPRPDGHLAIAGHSVGAALALRMAAPGEPAIPTPELVVLHDAAGRRAFADLLSEGGALARVPPTVALLVMQAQTSGPGEANEPDSFSPEAWEGTAHLTRRNFLRSYGDRHGTPVLVSNHNGCRSGTSARPLDAHDHFACWRPTEGALREAQGAAFPGYSALCAGPGPECDPVRDHGVWGDGVPVRRLANAADLGL